MAKDELSGTEDCEVVGFLQPPMEEESEEYKTGALGGDTRGGEGDGVYSSPKQ